MQKHLDKLDDHLHELLKYLKEFPEDQLNHKPSPASWSALQTCHHVMLAEKLSLRYLRKKLSYEGKFKKVTLATRMREQLLKTYLTTPMKFKAPDNVGSEVLPDHSSWTEVDTAWRSQRSELRDFLMGLPEELLDREVYKHPFAGRLSLSGMLVFFQDHFKRHEKQMKKALRSQK